MTEPHAVFVMPTFSLGIWGDDVHLHLIRFLPLREAKMSFSPLLKETLSQLAAWQKDPTKTCFDLPLLPSGTPFQNRVWQAILKIPCGATQSYAQIAEALGSAPRAVGGACGANPFPVIVPCHRVIAKDGTLGGFARHTGGFLMDVKRDLLSYEDA